MISQVNSNIELLLENFRTLEERPIRTLEARIETFNNRISLFNDLKSKISSLNSLVSELKQSGTLSIYGKKAATSSDETVATVTASSTAVVTSHTLFVSQLAKADKVVSNQYTLTGTDISSTLGAGTYTFDVTVNGTTTSVSVDIAAGEDNETVLNNIVTAVNNTSNVGIRASVIQDSDTTGRLVFTSEETGADYEMTLSDTSGTLLSTLGLNDSVQASGTNGGYIYDSSELNALVTIDGISVSSNSNTLDNAIEGLTITLHKTQATGEQDVTINVSNDVETIKSKIEEFINAYNDVLDFIITNTAVNTSTYERSAFSGDFSITNLRLQMRQAMGSAVTGLAAGDPTLLTDLGISIGKDGKLSISDSDKLEDMITDNLSQVEQLFNSSDGFAPRLESILDEMSKGDGIIEKRKDVLQNNIDRINNRIEQMRKSIDKKMESYRQQFSQLQAAYVQFQMQSNFISSLTG
ncbi:MAG: hypothetical protein D6748_02415 [Calditrichaeota bacterium]|nr:MAG: hypothetical protein D6748_02415 [Calditrichota bacterium]